MWGSRTAPASLSGIQTAVYDVHEIAGAFDVDLAAPSASREASPASGDESPINEGSRNETLFRLGRSLRAKGLTEAGIGAALLAENRARCVPPLPEEEVRATAKSAASKAAGHSAQWAAEHGAAVGGGAAGNVVPMAPARAERARQRGDEKRDATARAGKLVERYVFVIEQGQWYDRKAGIYSTKEALNSAYLGDFPDPKISTAILTHARAQIVDTVTWMPDAGQIIEVHGARAVNTWRDDGLKWRPGDPTNFAPWMEHVEWLVPDGGMRRHLLDWLSFTLRFPGKKINHQLLLGGLPRIGKDTLIQPLIRGLGASNVAQPYAEEIGSEFNDFLDRRKLVVFQEIHSFQRRDIENKLKPLCAAPPDSLRVNIKGVRHYTVPNLVSLVFMTNHWADAVSISPGDGRYFCVWSPVSPRRADYYRDLYAWMDGGGDRAVIRYLKEDHYLDQFQPGASPPGTEWKHVLQGSSVPRLEFSLGQMIEEETPPFDRDIVRLQDILKEHPRLAQQEAIVPVALQNLGAVRRKCVWRSAGEGKLIKRLLWIVRRHDVLGRMSATDIGREWEKSHGN